MQAFHNDPAIKRKYLKRVAAHRRADQIAQGTYYDRRSGRLRACAVGCTIHGSDHAAYERELGIPTWLAQLEDRVHEGLSLEDCREWPGQFLRAVPVGADLDPIRPSYFVWLLDAVAPFAALREDTRGAVATVRALWARVAAGEVVAPEAWLAARTAADAAAAAAWAADAADAAWADAAAAAAVVAADAAAARAAWAVAAAAVAVADDDAWDGTAARRAFYGDVRDWLLGALKSRCA